MKTKPIQPATPLPWRVAPDDPTAIIANDAIVGGYDRVRQLVAQTSPDGLYRSGMTDADCVAEAHANARDIVTAANAYPRLLAERAELAAALRRVLETARNGTMSDRDIATGHARDVLRKLGAE